MNRSGHLKVKGMHCTGCEETIENSVRHLPGVRKVKADYVKQTVDVEFDDKLVEDAGIRLAIEEKGYEFENASTASANGYLRNGVIDELICAKTNRTAHRRDDLRGLRGAYRKKSE